jgi:hypothetical protein
LAWSHAVIRDCHGLACSSKCSAPPGTSSFQNYSAKLTGVMDAACRCDFLYSSTYRSPLGVLLMTWSPLVLVRQWAPFSPPPSTLPLAHPPLLLQDLTNEGTLRSPGLRKLDDFLATSASTGSTVFVGTIGHGDRQSVG